MSKIKESTGESGRKFKSLENQLQEAVNKLNQLISSGEIVTRDDFKFEAGLLETSLKH